jgi:hypothetical protein
MSFDLYFLRATPGTSWQDLMEQLEEEELRPLDDADVANWASIKAQLTDLLPDAENVDGEQACEFSDDRPAADARAW